MWYLDMLDCVLNVGITSTLTLTYATESSKHVYSLLSVKWAANLTPMANVTPFYGILRGNFNSVNEAGLEVTEHFKFRLGIKYPVAE